jgi:hypothetical protein
VIVEAIYYLFEKASTGFQPAVDKADMWVEDTLLDAISLLASGN